MNLPAPGVAFSWSQDGDLRSDQRGRTAFSRALGISPDWATVDQVHGADVRVVSGSGLAGAADALVTTTPNLPVAVFTADCLGVVLRSEGAVGVAHAGWRGLGSGVLETTLEAVAGSGPGPVHAFLGPAIGPCCFEVGPEVAERFADDLATTTWGTTSVDLVAAARRRLGGVAVHHDGRCTACGDGFSHRRDATTYRMAAVGWLA